MSCGIRILGKVFLDNTLLYEKVIVLLCHFSFAFGILQTIRWIRATNESAFDSVLNSNFMIWLDNISVYVYSLHGIFISGMLSVFNLNMNPLLSTFFVFVFSFMLASICYYIFEHLGRTIKHKYNN